jgi:very-short-patch-repair endonuclease
MPPVPQYRVVDGDGRFLARVDLGYPAHRVAVEYDGAWHADTDQLRRDRRRLNRLVAAGWAVLHLTAADLREPEALVDRVRRLLADHEIREPRAGGAR